MRDLITLVLVLALSLPGNAQSQWRFHLAFEDATGARDTIWLIWDTGATQGSDSNPLVDEELGEGAAEMDPSAFNVWIYNWALDSTKTFALPYQYFPSHGVEVRAFNVQFPVTLEWDTALFHAALLPNPAAIQTARMDCNHFFSFNNDPPLQAYNMLLDDSVSVEMMFPNDALFPLLVTTDGDAHAAQQEHVTGKLDVFPNPAADHITWSANEQLTELRVLDAQGRSMVWALDPAADRIDLSGLPAGLYVMEGIANTKHHYHAKLVKLH